MRTWARPAKKKGEGRKEWVNWILRENASYKSKQKQDQDSGHKVKAV